MTETRIFFGVAVTGLTDIVTVSENWVGVCVRVCVWNWEGGSDRKVEKTAWWGAARFALFAVYYWGDKVKMGRTRCTHGYSNYGLCLIPDRNKRFVCSAQHPGWLWNPPSLQYVGIWRFFGDKAAGAWNWPGISIYYRYEKWLEL
jgi:hypothetical protein